MQCTAPEVYYHRDPALFEGVRGLTKSPSKAVDRSVTVTVRCGKCMDCRLSAAHEWSIRVMHECKMYDSNVFVTLTYDDGNLPGDYGLDYRHFQLFLHRLRKSVPGRGRFFMCGEYGERFGRPHYHAVLFNCDFPDKVFWKRNERGDPLFTSAELSGLWGKGFCSFGDATLESADYVARYTTKKITGPSAGAAYQWISEDGEVFDREPPFLQPSLKPGLGARWFEKYRSDVFPCDYLVFDGKKFPVPRYYSKLLEREDRAAEALVKARRRVKLKAKPKESGRRLHDRATYRRLISENKRDVK